MYYKIKVDSDKELDYLTTDGYLEFKDNVPWVYTKGEAIKKASIFSGNLVKVDDIPTITKPTMVVISGNGILLGIRELLKHKELFVSNDVESKNSFIYDGSVFFTLMMELIEKEKKNIDFKINYEIRQQLYSLNLLIESEFIMIKDMCFS